MEVSQKRFSNRTKFEFGDEELKYTLKDKGSSGDIQFKYGEFPVSSNMLEERNEWFRNAGLIWVALGSFLLISAIFDGEPLTGKGFWLVVGIICLVFYHFSPTKYTVFSMDCGKVYVIKDKKHDTIIREIKARKKTQLLSWHGEINRENDPEYEIGKFNWLKEQGVLTESEAEKKIAQVKWTSQSL